ncbi:hypothetical protein HYH02_001550 [Chlamydomonas schloesseri]|uniref:Uncharacterized protein n=1 Tax=Chlamydomonas schloesseri TaxID=2026947 RepID=A0A835WTG1_9CHLO|nr:hypothetical protein HYH02_001550 [Chlamydomonas schloesseri]|eukprot:KAG2453326.1 hypothetical protein HYH02_001550 [Chlamydomonas schloesseri]
MLALKLFKPADDKVRQVEFHPVLPWIVSATKSNYVSVWDWRTRQVVWEAQLGGGDEELSTDAELARLHLRDAAFAPNPSLLHPTPHAGAPGGTKRDPTGAVRDVKFLDSDVAQVQLSWEHSAVAGCGSPPPRAEDIAALRGHRLLVIACENKVLVVDLASRRLIELGKGVFEGRSPTCLAFLFKAGLHTGGSLGGAAPSVSSQVSAAALAAAGARGGSGRGGGWLLDSPVLAVGCSDGIVRCLQIFPVKPVVRLMSAHKTAVVAMAVMGVRGQRFETLAVGHQGGSVALFEPMGRAAGGGSGGAGGGSAAAAAAAAGDAVGPRADVKAHDKELLPGSLVVVPVAEDPENTRCLLFSAGGDHRVCGLDMASLKEVSKIKVDRATLTCLAHWPRGWVCSGVHSLLLGTEGGHVLLAHAGSGSVRQAADLADMVPAGTKKAPKVYGLAVHPTQPDVVAAATNTGVAVLALATPPHPLPVVPLPLASPAQALHDDGAAALGAAFGGGGAGGGGCTYVTAMGGAVLCVTAATLPNAELADLPPNQVMGKLQVAGDVPSGRALLTASADGGYVAVAWPAARTYAVYRQGASAWSEVARGHGTSVAWHASQPIFAVLEEAPPALPAGAAPPGKPSKDPKKAAAAAEAARLAAEAAARAAAATAAVRIKEVGGVGGSSVAPHGLGGGGLDLGGDLPAYVQSGPLLAVTLRRQVAAEGAELAGGQGSAMVWLDWEGGRRLEPELAEPLLLAWDPSRSMVALAYPSQILVLRARPEFAVVASLPVGGAESLEWAARQLFISTPTHILCALLAPAPPPLPDSAAAAAAGAPPAYSAAAPARLITLAGPGAPVAAAAMGAVVHEGLAPPPMMRPAGPLALLGPRDGCLWAVGVLGQPLAMSLAHPGLRACSLVAAGDLHGAVQLASRALAPELHDPLAALMLEMDGLRGAAAAATLPGISLATELRLRACLRHWQQAVEAADALMAGFVRRPPPGQFRSAVAAAAFGTLGGGGYGGGGGGPALGDEFVDLSAAGGGKPANAPAHPQDLDWTQPLRAASSSARAAATAAVAARPLAAAYMPAAAAPAGSASSTAPLSPETVGLVLGLLDDLLRGGQHDVARHLARPLLGGAVALGGEQLRRLTAILAQVGMKTDLPALSHAVASGADTASRESAALLAALLCGHTAMAQDALRDGGAAALAALQAKVYGLSGAADAMAAWRRQLLAAAPLGTAAAMGRLDVSMPAAV